MQGVHSKHRSLFDDEDEDILSGRLSAAESSGSSNVAKSKVVIAHSIFSDDADSVNPISKKYPSLFGDDDFPTQYPSKTVPKSTSTSVPKKNLFDDEDHAPTPTITIKKNPPEKVKPANVDLFGDDRGADKNLFGAKANAKSSNIRVLFDDADIPMAKKDLPPAAPQSASENNDGAYISEIANPTSNSRVVEDMFVEDETDESMFEMKYYEERAKRIKLENKVSHLVMVVTKLKERLSLNDIAIDDLEESLDGELIPNIPICDDSIVLLESVSNSDPAPHLDYNGTSVTSECNKDEAIRARELARRQRQQHFQKRPVSVSSRRLAQAGNPTKPSSGKELTAVTSDRNHENVLDSSPTADVAASNPGFNVSKTLSWSSDEADPASDMQCKQPAVIDITEVAETSVVETAAEEARNRRRQKAYSATMGARPTSRRLGAMKASSAKSNKVSEAQSIISAPPKRRISTDGNVKRIIDDKWSDSDEDLEDSMKPSEQVVKNREDSFEWDSDEGKNVSTLPVVVSTAIETDEESADRRVVAWARGKDIVTMILTFRDIYEDTSSLPEGVLNPILNNPGDVRKAYLKIVRYCHPDKQSSSGAMKYIAPKLFSALTDAYNAFRSMG